MQKQQSSSRWGGGCAIDLWLTDLRARFLADKALLCLKA